MPHVHKFKKQKPGNPLYEAIEEYNQEMGLVSPVEARKAVETLIRQHQAEQPRNAHYGAVRKHAINGKPDTVVYTVSGPLVAAFDEMLSRLDITFNMTARETAIEVQAVQDPELVELRRMARLEGPKL